MIHSISLCLPALHVTMHDSLVCYSHFSESILCVLFIGLIDGDGNPSCFSDVKDTGIPDLQQWCHTLTLTRRECAAQSFRDHLKTFATSIQTYIQGIGAVTNADRVALREKWASADASGERTASGISCCLIKVRPDWSFYFI
jgi:hypothetical protein